MQTVKDLNMITLYERFLKNVLCAAVNMLTAFFSEVGKLF